MNLELLKQINEWAAYGYYEAINLPWPRCFGMAYRRLYENAGVAVPDGKYLLPDEPVAMAWDMQGTPIKKKNMEDMIFNFHHSPGLSVFENFIQFKKEKYPQHSVFIDELTHDLKNRLKYYGGYTHSNPDTRTVLTKGFNAMAAELEEETAKAVASGDEKEINLMLMLKDYTEGVRTYYENVKKALKAAADSAKVENKEKLSLIANEFAACFLEPSSTFIQGLLAVNFTWMLDVCDGIGRLDQDLGTLFEKDIASGRLDIGFARELLDELWRNFERYNGWSLQIGGYTSDGKDGYNLLTQECIACCERNKLRRPNVAFRITKETPEEGAMAAIKALSKGSGRPALYNDDLYVNTLIETGLVPIPEDARELGFGGCTETMIPGMSNVGSTEGSINLAKAMELAMFDGYDPVRKIQVGPHTGKFTSFKCFDEFLVALREQIAFLNYGFASWLKSDIEKRRVESDPKPYRTFFTRDCVKRHRSFEDGGARYNWSVLIYQGVSNLIDSVAAIKKCVFDDGTVEKKELVAALENNFEKYEHIQKLLLDAPKFGNDNAEYDLPGCEMVGYAWKHMSMFENGRGGICMPCVSVFTTYGWAGREVGATPDGRKAFEVLTDSVGATQGLDTNGPTALMNSVLRLPLQYAIGTPVLNIRFQKEMMNTGEGQQKIWMLIKSFFERGGLQVQLTVVSKEELVDAKKEPSKYKDLIVRIGGYSEFFVNLSEDLQDSVIKRTEHA